ncbi:MAG: hypothetical protein Q7U35_07520 [Methanobacteriaceae archaeon]|nr:hypothetical protein [Methanobacteriaceae archaeon]MDP2837303.1 hypothetical protein [Methanobacteriaceae archaeon]MDP3033897.1 hypothetical protein [Methanobacteriaceae archaeon]MDP3483915.1 hypothetical protein [Methanobacteriaceae archaeon]
MRIKLIRELKGRELVQEFRKTYGSISELEKLYENNLDNLKLYTDLEDWKYFSENLDETMEDGKIIFIDKLVLGEEEKELLDLIVNKKPQSIKDLAQILNWDLKKVYPKIIQLEKYDLIELKSGPKKALVPALKYDKMEIVE